MPDLRIIEEALWQEVKQRQGAIRKTLMHDGRGVRSERARRPPHLFSGLLRCGTCGGGFSMISATHYGCSQARNRGTCTNRLTIRRDRLETQVLDGLKSHLMQPALVAEFVDEYHRALDDLVRDRNAERQRLIKEQETVGREIGKIIDAVKQGLFSPSLQQALIDFEQRKAAVSGELVQSAPPPLRLHPNLSAVYRTKVENLREALNAEDTRAEAAQILRRLISAIRLVPEDGQLRIHLCGYLAGILALAAGTKKPGPVSGAGSVPALQGTLVAGA
ncbi:MAG: zinc ribbon domain-containing protein [Alphaproteobacteria bacterium]|nr:zinc ribbon domain-containing protein [Alphaproteobacteria bacterium]